MSEPRDRTLLRARLGRPGSRTVVAFALITALGCGLYLAAIASWAAWWTQRPPHRAEAVAVFTELLPGTDIADHVSDDPRAVFAINGMPLTWAGVDSLIFGDGGEYQLAGIASRLGPDVGPADQQRVVDGVLDRLRAGGWSVGEPEVTLLFGCGPGCDPATAPRETVVSAGRGDQVITVYAFAAGDRGSNGVSVTLHRPTPTAVHPAAAAAGLLGALVGWWLFALASRRSTGRRGLPVKILFGLFLFLWWAPIVLVVPQMAGHHLDEWHYSWHPLWEWLGQPALSLPFLVATAFGLAALGVAALPRRQARAAASGQVAGPVQAEPA